MVMPGGMGGRELAEAASELRPGLPVLFTSGYTEDAMVIEGRLGRGVHLLHKPYRRNELATKLRLPSIYNSRQYVEDGGLMTYGVNFADLYGRAATYVDKILKGRKPADLPIEQPIKFELIINLKAAKQIGLTIPPNVLARADRVIR